MSNLLARMKTYNFWISFVSAIILVLRIIGDKFNFFVDATLIMDITTGLCGIFVVLGIISAPSGKKEVNVENSTNQNVVGRFEQIQAETKEIQTLANENITEEESEIIEQVDIESTVEENVETEENEIEIVENDAIIEAKIQSEIQNEKETENLPKTNMEEIKELLALLIEKVDNM